MKYFDLLSLRILYILECIHINNIIYNNHSFNFIRWSVMVVVYFALDILSILHIAIVGYLYYNIMQTPIVN